jgi:hypothetical protein
VVDGELLGDRPAGGDAHDGDRPGERPHKRFGVVAGQIGDNRAWLDAGLAVDQVDGKVAGQGPERLQIEPAGRTGGVDVFGGEGGEHHQGRSLADGQVGQPTIEHALTHDRGIRGRAATLPQR